MLFLAVLLFYVCGIQSLKEDVCDVKSRICGNHRGRENISLGGDDHGIFSVGVELGDVVVDGIGDLVHHNLLLLEDFLLLLAGIGLETLLLLDELLILGLCH